MSMSDDWKRLSELERTKGTLQYGQYLEVFPTAGNPDLVLVSKDLIRFVGEKTDVNAWRVYLGPWEPKSPMTVIPAVAATNYADPSPWSPPEPRLFDSFVEIMPCYARVQWGSGGIQHTAYIDWPRRGALFQVSGSYLQVNAFVNVGVLGVPESRLPILRATMAPEPGGGDSSVPATFTYKAQAPQAAAGPTFFQNFQVPPFARAFVLLMPSWPGFTVAGGRMRVATQGLPTTIALGPNEQVWETPIAATTAYDDGYLRFPVPIAGQDVGSVRVELTNIVAPVNIGCQFYLDL